MSCNTLHIRGNHLPEKGSEVVQTAEVSFGSVRLELQLSWGEGETEVIAPLFDGAAWAGTMIWPASEALANYLISAVSLGVDDRSGTFERLNGGNVIELGVDWVYREWLCTYYMLKSDLNLNEINQPIQAKTIPSNILSYHFFKTILTDQEITLSLTRLNLEKNKHSLSGIEAVALDWKELSHKTMGCDRAKQFLASFYGSESIDIVLSADCIYEPLYEESWRDLLGTVDALHQASLQPPLILISVERRTADGVDFFINECTKMGRNVDCVWKMIYCDGKWYPPETKSPKNDCQVAATAVEEARSPRSGGRERHGALIEIYSI